MNNHRHSSAATALSQFFSVSTNKATLDSDSVYAPNQSLTELFENTFSVELEQEHSKENSAIADNIRDGRIRDTALKLCDSLPSEFQSLSCIVAGFRTSIPLLELGRIIRPNKKLQKLGKSDVESSQMFKGIFFEGENKFQCLNEYFWFGIKHQQNVDEDVFSKHYLQLGKSSFVLECSELGSTKMLNKSLVKWHDKIHHKPWIVGVVTESMEVLIDSTKLVEQVLK